jgi:hypothetical protein
VSDVSDKVDATMVDLSLAIQNVGVIRDFSNVHFDQVRIAVIYLSAAVMDCLTGLIDWVTRSGTISLVFMIDVSVGKGFYHARLRPEARDCAFTG